VIVTDKDSSDGASLMWRLRRNITKARSSAWSGANYRQGLALAEEIRTEIRELTKRLDAISKQIEASSRTISAVSAYSRCAILLGQNQTVARSERAKP
jgi:hypothetical protein